MKNKKKNKHKKPLLVKTGYYGLAFIDANKSRQDAKSKQKQWKRERKKHGFDSTELWGLDSTLVSFLLPRLKYFRKHCAIKITPAHYCFDGYTHDDWLSDLDDMIDGFEIYDDEFAENWEHRTNLSILLLTKMFRMLSW